MEESSLSPFIVVIDEEWTKRIEDAVKWVRRRIRNLTCRALGGHEYYTEAVRDQGRIVNYRQHCLRCLNVTEGWNLK